LIDTTLLRAAIAARHENSMLASLVSAQPAPRPPRRKANSPIVSSSNQSTPFPQGSEPATRTPRCQVSNISQEGVMGRGILLWLLGVPIPVILILALLFR
jgi:hypothetical protein